MQQLPKCPECGSEYTYEDGELYPKFKSEVQFLKSRKEKIVN